MSLPVVVVVVEGRGGSGVSGVDMSIDMLIGGGSAWSGIDLLSNFCC